MNDYKRLTLHKVTSAYDYEKENLSKDMQAAIYDRLAELEDKLESGEYGDITAERRRAEALELENDTLRKKISILVVDRQVYYIASIWNDATLTRRKEVRKRIVDYSDGKFVYCDGLVLSLDEINFTKEAAEEKLKELQEGKE